MSPSRCPACGAESAMSDYCDTCGAPIDGEPVGGSNPTPPPLPAPSTLATPSPTPSEWVVHVGADRRFFDSNITAGAVSFPAPRGPRRFPLTGAEVSVGRRSESIGVSPDLDLAAAPDDPAVSRRHALLRRREDGSWSVVDAGSSNGTWVNDEAEPLAPGVARPLADGDSVFLGAFTCITLRHEPPG